MEHVLLRVLDFKMAAPTTNQFLHLLMSVQPVSAIAENLALVSKINNANASQTTDLYPLPLNSVFHFHLFIWWCVCVCLQYAAELSLLEIDPFLKYTPSMVAAGAYCLATYTVSKSLWVSLFRSLFFSSRSPKTWVHMALFSYILARFFTCLYWLYHGWNRALPHRPAQALHQRRESPTTGHQG